LRRGLTRVPQDLAAEPGATSSPPSYAQACTPIGLTACNDAWNPAREPPCGRQLRWPSTRRSNEGGFRCRLVTRQHGPASELAERLGQRPKRWRSVWQKLRALAARLPFAEDLVAAHYCAFDRQTPLHVKAALIGALAYFVLPA